MQSGLLSSTQKPTFWRWYWVKSKHRVKAVGGGRERTVRELQMSCGCVVQIVRCIKCMQCVSK